MALGCWIGVMVMGEDREEASGEASSEPDAGGGPVDSKPAPESANPHTPKNDRARSIPSPLQRGRPGGGQRAGRRRGSGG